MRNAFEHILGKILRRGLQFVEGWKLVDIAMVQVLHHLIRGAFNSTKSTNNPMLSSSRPRA
jgi:hypothetical protein